MMEKKIMKAAVCEEFGKPLKIKEVEIEELKANDCLVKIHASGVCHTDLHAVTGDWPVKPKLPLIPGHEGVGEVIAIGSNVHEVKVGDRVGIPWLYSACGTCEYCLTGRETLCHQVKNGGYSVDGGYAQYCVADARYVGHIPVNLSYEVAAPIMCAGVTTYKALKHSKVKPGEWVAVFGIGGLGHLGIQYAKAMGMKVVAVDIDDEKLKLAKRHGVDWTVNSMKEDAGQVIQEKIGGVQGCIVTAVAKKPFAQAYESIKNGGTMVCVGLPPEKMEIPIFDTVLKEIHITGSIVGTRKDLEEALQFASDGKIEVDIIKTKLEDINDTFNKMKKGEILGRVVMQIA